MAGKARPTRESILQLATLLEQRFAEQNTQIRAGRAVRDLTDVVTLPKRIERVAGFEMHDPSLADEIKRIVSAVCSRPPKVVVTPGDPQADAAQRNASLRERWTEQVLIEASTKTIGEDTYERNVDEAFGDGGAWCKLLYDKHLWEQVWNTPDEEDDEDGEAPSVDYAEGEAPSHEIAPNGKLTRKKKAAGRYLSDREGAKKEAGVPFRLINLDVETVNPLFSGTELACVLEIVQRPVAEIVQTYGPKAAPNSRVYGQPAAEREAMQYGQTARFITYTDDTWIAYLADYGAEDAQLLRVIRHGYNLGHPPIYYCPGYMMNWWRGRKVGWGLGQERIELIRAREFLWLLVVNIAAMVAGTPMKHTRPPEGEQLIPDGDQPQDDEIELWELSGFYDMKPGEDIAPITLPGIPQPVNELLSILDRRIAALETPRLPVGNGDLSGAGFTYAQIIAEIKTSYDVFVKHLQQMYVQIIRDLWKLTREVVGETVYVHYSPPNPRGREGAAEWLGAGPEELSDAVGVQFVINSDPPTAEIVKARYWSELLISRLAYRDQAMQELGFNPEEIRRGQLMEKMRDSPQYENLAIERLLQELDRGDLLRRAAVAAAQSGMLPGLPPEIAQQVAQQQLGAGQPMGQPPGGGPGSAGNPGMPIMPDQAALRVAPQGQGAAPIRPPGQLLGAPQTAMPQPNGLRAGVQNLGGGR